MEHRFLRGLQRLTAGRIADQFRHKKYQKKRKDYGYKIFERHFSKKKSHLMLTAGRQKCV